MLKTKTKNQKFNATSIVCATALALCLYAPGVEAFGGLGILGHKSSHKGGVNAIGVHIDANSTQQPDIEIVNAGNLQENMCPEDVTKDNNGYCALCDNGNLYFPYRDEPCAEETPINKIHCESDSDCEVGCCSANGWCTNAWFISCDTDRSCLSNNDCESGEFCDLKNSGNYSGTRWPGVCTDIGPKREIEYNNKTFVQSTELYTSFLGAMNWCHAQGKKMATSEDLGLSESFLCDDCHELDLTAFILNEDGFHFWLNNGMKLYKEVYDEDLDLETFRVAGIFWGVYTIGWAPDKQEDEIDTNGALCK